MAPSNVNNAARELMGHIRDMYEQLGDGYFEFGDGDKEYTIARVDADTLTIATAADLSTTYFAGRKIRVTDGGANVVEGTIASTSHGSSLQTVNLTGISLASGTPTKVEIGIDTAAFGGKLILDDDGDTFIEAPTDDTIDIHIAGAKDFVFTANTFTAESGSTIAAQALTATTVNASGIVTGSGFTAGSAVLAEAELELLDGLTAGTAIASKVVTTDANIDTSGQRNLTISGELDAATGDFSGAVDVAGAITSSAGATITTADNTSQLTLISTDADATVGPNLRLKRDSSSPEDGDVTGRIIFSAENDASEEINFFEINSSIGDASDGAEGGRLTYNCMVAGTSRNILDITASNIVFNQDSQDVDFRIESNDATHAFFIDANANAVMTGKSGPSVLDVGVETRVEGASNGILGVASATVSILSYFNRTTSDGVIIGLYQAQSQEGNISVSGTTVSYNAFTGSHWSRLADNSKPTILRGTVMESLDTMMDWYQAVAEVAETTDETGQVIPARTVKESIALGDKSVGDAITFTSNPESGDGKEYTGTIVKEDDVKHVYSKISDTADSKRVYGLFHCWDNDDDSVNDMEVAQVGTYIIRVHKDVTVAAGDLLVSNGDGTAKLQDDDIIRSKTVAKVNSNVKVETYADGSYTVPCTLHC
jgi:hypothetical protein